VHICLHYSLSLLSSQQHSPRRWTWRIMLCSKSIVRVQGQYILHSESCRRVATRFASRRHLSTRHLPALFPELASWRGRFSLNCVSRASRWPTTWRHWPWAPTLAQHSCRQWTSSTRGQLAAAVRKEAFCQDVVRLAPACDRRMRDAAAA